MVRYITRRFLGSLLVLLGVVLFSFVIIRAAPGGPFRASGRATVIPAQLEGELERLYGLDKPIYEQVILYLRNVARGELGPLFARSTQSVREVISQSLPVTLQLGALSILLGYLVGIPVGSLAAIKHNTIVDHAATFTVLLGLSIPNLVLGPLLILIFGLHLDWLPFGTWGATPPFLLGIFPRLSVDFFTHAVLPTVTLGTAFSASVTRITRASLLEVLTKDYINTARAKGLAERAVMARHALRNSLIPIVTISGRYVVNVLTGAFIVERIFGLNGLARHFIDSVVRSEYFLLTGCVLAISVLLITTNFIVDILYAFIDPRIRYR
ncbi:MAG: ABC transporter permease subunit [Anaerolineales bacterium]|nr:ABC transporter permease subunit [Anaerolineales bacterium]